MAMALTAFSFQAKTLVAYYSYTNTTEKVVNELRKQIDADVVEIEPADKHADYNANGYALGREQIDAINANPNSAASYPAIDPVDVNMQEYDMVIIAMPLWHAQMAAPFQAFLFRYGSQMAGKNICVIVSSWSSGISGVIADAKRLIPDGRFIEPYLWDSHSNPANATRIASWLTSIHYDALASSPGSPLSVDRELGIYSADGTVGVSGNFTSLALYDIAGNRVVETSQSEASIALLSSGIYVALATDGHRRVARKISVR